MAFASTAAVPILFLQIVSFVVLDLSAFTAWALPNFSTPAPVVGCVQRLTRLGAAPSKMEHVKYIQICQMKLQAQRQWTETC